MSDTLQAIQEAIQAHYRAMNGDGAVLTDWFVAYGGMTASNEADNGISHPSGYTASDSSPYAVLGVAHMGLNELQADLTPEYDDD